MGLYSRREGDSARCSPYSEREPAFSVHAAVSASNGSRHAQPLPLPCPRTEEAPGFPYGDKVVFLANDWHAGLVPTYIAGKYRQHGVYKVRGSTMAANTRDPLAEWPQWGPCLLLGSF